MKIFGIRRITDEEILRMQKNMEKQIEYTMAQMQAELYKEMERYRIDIHSYMAQSYGLTEQLQQEMKHSADVRQMNDQKIHEYYEQKLMGLEKRLTEQGKQIEEMHSCIKNLEEQIEYLQQPAQPEQPQHPERQPEQIASQPEQPQHPERQPEQIASQPEQPQHPERQPEQIASQPVQPQHPERQPEQIASQPVVQMSEPQIQVLFRGNVEEDQHAIKQIIFQCSVLRKEWEEKYGSIPDFEIYFKILDKCSKKFSGLFQKMSERAYDSEYLATETAMILNQTMIKALAKESIRSDVGDFLEKCMLRKVVFAPGQELSDDDYEYVDDLVCYEDVADEKLHNCVVEVIQDAYAVGYKDEEDEYEAAIPGIYRVGKYKPL